MFGGRRVTQMGVSVMRRDATRLLVWYDCPMITDECEET